MTGPLLYFSGVDYETGDYVLPPASPNEVAAVARGSKMSAENLVDARFWLRQGSKGLRSGDPRSLAESGWGVIFAQNDPNTEAICAALKDLLDLRRSQVGAREHYYREFRGGKGYRTGDTKRSFLSRHGVGPGAADPEFMPYYLLIVGSPEVIPYEFQYQLDMQYAVGRVWFETVEEYRCYAQGVVAAETSTRTREHRAAFFAPQHQDDEGTALSAMQLAAPLAVRAAKNPDWTVAEVFGEDATKARLHALLGGADTPDLLFTSGHGMVLRSGHPLQPVVQGALMCQDWPGPHAWEGAVPRSFFFGGDDLSGSVSGLISFHFACFSAGGPAYDDFSQARERPPIAPQPFVSHLPLRLLKAGALAVVGHVERAWFCSIEWPGAGTQIQPFEDAIDRLLAGHPVGSAMEPFGQRYAELGSDLSSQLEEVVRGGPVNTEQLAELWTNSHDARNYIVLGDPAVRLFPSEVKP